MAEIWTKLELEMPTQTDYNVVAIVVKRCFDDKQHYPVEDYQMENLRIVFEEIPIDADDVLWFANALNDQIKALARRMKQLNKDADTISSVSNAAFKLFITLKGSQSKHLVFERKREKTENC